MRKILFAFVLIVISIASCSKKSAPTTVAKAKGIDAVKIFADDCARCHGVQGIKDSRTPNLQTIALDKSQLVTSITNGKGHMPAWKDKLSPAEISAVADLIVGWHKK